MHAVNANGVPVVIAAQPMQFAQDTQRIYSNMRNDYAKKLIIFGSLQIVFGALSIIFEAVSVGIFATYWIASWAPIGYGFWTGIIFIITGSFGIAGGKQRNVCCVITFNVLSIFSACLTAVLLSLAIVSANSYSFNISYYRNRNTEPANAGVAMESLMAIIAVFEAIVAIWSSVICCKIGACCCDCGSPPPTNTPYVQIAMAGQQPYPVINNGYNQQPQPQIMIAQQQQMSHPMPYGHQPVYEQYSYNQPNTGYDNSK